MKNWRKWITIVGGCLLLCVCQSALGIEIKDIQDDQVEYGKKVAELIQKSDRNGHRRVRSGGEHILVLMKTDGQEIDLSGIGAEVCLAGPKNRFTLLFYDEDTAEKAIQELRKEEHVKYAEKDVEVSSCDLAVNDKISFQSYGAEKMFFQPVLSWTRKKHGNVQIAVIDSGIGSHPVLNSRVVKGWDYIDNDDDPTNDESGHGTHVAGIIADCTQEISVDLYAIRILNASGKGNVSNAANAVLEAAEKGVSVINLSFTAPGESAALDDAVESAVASGCIVVIAAGNYGLDAAQFSPAHLTIPGVIVVGAVAESGERANYSNYGASVDCYAYGSGINSCVPGGGYARRSGTSQATPHIAAVCAMMRILYGESPAMLENRIKSLRDESMIVCMEGITPERIPCHLTHVTLGVEETLQLPIWALPLSSEQVISWTSLDEETVLVDVEGVMTALKTGEAEVFRTCSNFEDARMIVTVQDKASGEIRLPETVTVVEDEALLGIGGDYLLLGEQIVEFEQNALDENLVIITSPDSPMADYAEREGLQYLSY